MRAQKYVVLPDEDGAEFVELEAALVEELARVGALQIVLARRVAVAAWRLARADRTPNETELFEERRAASGGLGLALIRDGNGARWFETLLRYRGAAMAEFWRAPRTLKALQAEQAHATSVALATPARADLPQPNEPERRAMPRLDYAQSPPSAPGGTLHEPAAPWLPNQPESPARRPARPHPNLPPLPTRAEGQEASASAECREHQTNPMPAETCGGRGCRQVASPIAPRQGISALPK